MIQRWAGPNLDISNRISFSLQPLLFVVTEQHGYFYNYYVLFHDSNINIFLINWFAKKHHLTCCITCLVSNDLQNINWYPAPVHGTLPTFPTMHSAHAPYDVPDSRGTRELPSKMLKQNVHINVLEIHF